MVTVDGWEGKDKRWKVTGSEVEKGKEVGWEGSIFDTEGIFRMRTRAFEVLAKRRGVHLLSKWRRVGETHIHFGSSSPPLLPMAFFFLHGCVPLLIIHALFKILP